MIERTTIIGRPLTRLAALLIVSLWFLQVYPANSSELRMSATLESTQMVLGDSVKLLLEIPQRWANTGPDLTPLETQFVIRNVNPSHAIDVQDGRVEQSTRWVVELEPHQSGQIVIPALRVHHYVSSPLRLFVQPERETSDRATRSNLFIELETEPSEVRANAQLSLTVRLLADVPIARGVISEPLLENAVVLRLGNDTHTFSERLGRRYRVIERRYAIFAQTAGELQIDGIRFRGEIATSTDDNAISPFGQTRHTTVDAFPATVKVLPAPTPAGIVAQRLHVEEHWSAPITALRVGQSITRQIRIETIGQRAEQIPSLRFQPLPNFDLYPGTPQWSTRSDRDTVRGVWTQSIAMVPRQTGEYQLPAIRIDWWNSQSNRAEVALLESQSLRVGVERQLATSMPTPGSTTFDGSYLRDLIASEIRVWQLACAGLVLLWLTTLALWYRSTTAPGVEGRRLRRLRAAKAEVLLAATANDAQRTREALIRWGQVAKPDNPPSTLGQIEQMIESPPLKQALQDLQHRIYAADALAEQETQWTGAMLFEQAKTGLVLAPNKYPRSATRAALAPLNPE